MAKQEFLQLAHRLDLNKVGVAGRYVSEKLDGQRFMWDGGVSRGLLAKEVPYANTEKDSRYLLDQPATGLWSRYGKAIQAPDWWLDQMPPFPVEGELWVGYREFQRVSSIVRSSVNVSAEWKYVIAKIFDAPPAVTLFRPRRINPNPNVDFEINENAAKWWKGRHRGPATLASTPFRQRYRFLEIHLKESNNVKLLEQVQLPHSHKKAVDELNRVTDQILKLGGEGTMVKAPNDLWLPERVRTLLKYKPFMDATGTVTGWTWGRETDRGSKLLGKMGAAIIDGTFKLSGFTDAEREMEILKPVDVRDVAGSEVDPSVARSRHFPIGTQIDYKYRELSDGGIPKEARFWRKQC